MKRNNVLTRKFISDNIKVNASVCSYPVRKVVSNTAERSEKFHLGIENRAIVSPSTLLGNV